MIEQHAYSLLENNPGKWAIFHPYFGLKKVTYLWDKPPYILQTVIPQSYYKHGDDFHKAEYEKYDKYLVELLRKAVESNGKAVLHEGGETKEETKTLEEADIKVGEPFDLSELKIQALIKINPRDLVVTTDSGHIAVFENWEHCFVENDALIPAEYAPSK